MVDVGRIRAVNKSLGLRGRRERGRARWASRVSWARASRGRCGAAPPPSATCRRTAWGRDSPPRSGARSPGGAAAAQAEPAKRRSQSVCARVCDCSKKHLQRRQNLRDRGFSQEGVRGHAKHFHKTPAARARGRGHCPTGRAGGACSRGCGSRRPATRCCTCPGSRAGS